MTESPKQSNSLFSTVISGGYCIGCGACAVLAPEDFQIRFDDFGRLVAVSSNDVTNKLAMKVCPFSDLSENEDALGRQWYGDIQKNNYTGHFRDIFAGHVSENKYREAGGSGGMGTWILTELKRKNMIDAAIHVSSRMPTDKDPRLFKYMVSRDVEAIQAGAKSKYYPTELSEAINLLKETPGRYAVTGLPCHIKAVRLMMNADETINSRIRFTVGLFCGHLKSRHFATALAWQIGIPPDQLQRFDFRLKAPNHPANDYYVQASGLSTETRRSRVLFGADWGLGLFKYRVCDYCDDIVAETADISIGDAWLPNYHKDWRGNNIVIIRNKKISELVNQACSNYRLNLAPISIEQLVASQSANYRHRREGLGYRLFLAQKNGRWHPPKRFKLDPLKNSPLKRLTFRMRVILAEQSHPSFAEALADRNFRLFKKRLRFFLLIYRLSNYRQLFRGVYKRFFAFLNLRSLP